MQCTTGWQRKRRIRIVNAVRRVLRDAYYGRVAGRSYLSGASVGSWRSELEHIKTLGISGHNDAKQRDIIQNALTWGVRNGLLASEMTRNCRIYGLPHKEKYDAPR